MRSVICMAVALSALTAGPAVGQDKLYKWVDENGNVTYQDRPPFEASGQVETLAGQGGQGQGDPAPANVPDVDVVLYAIDACDACDLVRSLLQQRGIPFTEKNAERDREVQTELKEIAGALSVPVLSIGDQVLKGYNEELMLNELEEAGFPISMQAAAPQQGQEDQSRKGSLSRQDPEGMTPEEIRQAARDAVSRGEDNDLSEEDEGFATLNEDFFPDEDGGAAPDDISELEEIPEDERIRVGE